MAQRAKKQKVHYLISARQAASALSTMPGKVVKLAITGEISAYNAADHWYFLESDINRYLQSKKGSTK